MIRYTCARCNKEMTCLKNDVPVVHFMNNDKKNGVDEFRYGDIWGCRNCDSKIVLGYGKNLLGIDYPAQCEKIISGEYEHIEIKR